MCGVRCAVCCALSIACSRVFLSLVYRLVLCVLRAVLFCLLLGWLASAARVLGAVLTSAARLHCPRFPFRAPSAGGAASAVAALLLDSPFIRETTFCK